MATFDISGLEDLMQEMEQKGQLVGEVAEQMVVAAGEELTTVIKQQAEQFTKSGRATGAMRESIGAHDGPRRGGNSTYIEVYPNGTDGKGVRNAEKAFILHYGKHGYPATYWMDQAVNAADAPVEARVRAIWESFIE